MISVYVSSLTKTIVVLEVCIQFLERVSEYESSLGSVGKSMDALGGL